MKKLKWMGGRIREARERKGMTKKELAERIGVTSTTVGRYEAGLREPRADAFLRIAKALNVRDLDWLAGFKEE